MAGKRISIGQVRRLMSEFADSIPDDMDSDLAQEWGEDLHKVLPVILRNYKPWDALAALERDLQESSDASQPVAILQYPADGVGFDLTIPEPFTGLDMVRRFGYDPNGWKFNGAEIAAPQTKRCKLVSVGYQPNWEALQAALIEYGPPLDGQWMDAFKKAFPVPDGKGPIGVANASWVRPHGYASFPCVNTGGLADFDLADIDFGACWRWLVEVQV